MPEYNKKKVKKIRFDYAMCLFKSWIILIETLKLKTKRTTTTYTKNWILKKEHKQIETGRVNANCIKHINIYIYIYILCYTNFEFYLITFAEM